MMPGDTTYGFCGNICVLDRRHAGCQPHHEAAIRRVVDYCRSVSQIRIGIQLANAGRKASTHRPWQERGFLKNREGAWQTVAPSLVPSAAGWPTPHALT